MTLNRPVFTLPGVGPKRAAALKKVGINTVLDLLLRAPRRYSDRRSSLSLSARSLQAALGESPKEVCVEGRLKGVRRVFTRRKGMQLVQGTLVGSDGEIRCVWFNRPYLAKTTDEDQEVFLCGVLRRGRNGVELLNADVSDGAEPRGLVASYGSIAGIGEKTFRRFIDDALGEPDSLADFVGPVPLEYLRKRELPTLGHALEHVHRPRQDASYDDLCEAKTPSHLRLIYGDLFAMQTKLAQASLRRRGREKGHSYRIDDALRAVVKKCLPFRLTGAQRRSLKEIVEGMRAEEPMLRLLQGDVGCGKTIIAAVAALIAAESGLQVAVLSPTELLAEQMASALARIHGDRHQVGLLTGSSVGRGELLSRIEAGKLLVVSGTHALIQGSVKFRELALVIIDEQHRFGVEQRMALAAKGSAPDVLLMTATPIPRSLALAVFGDLAISTIDELPPGREEIDTAVYQDTQRSVAVKAVQENVATGGRTFVVFPRIDNVEISRVSLEEHGALYRAAAGEKIAILTGRTPAEDRTRLLREFRDGAIAVLLATTVVEVGIDIPEANLIVIEGAEHFGLSQLHQLRGRVGRGAKRGRCIALRAANCAPESLARLEDFASIQDGFELAERDLRTRGPGDLLGVEQSGFSVWTADRLASAVEWLEAAREDAAEWVQESDILRSRGEPGIVPTGDFGARSSLCQSAEALGGDPV